MTEDLGPGVNRPTGIFQEVVSEAMSRYLQQVVTWPWFGPIDGSWAGHDPVPDLPAYDAFARIMRRVSEAYSLPLIARKIPNRVSEVRLVPRGLCDDDVVTVSAVAQRPSPSDFEVVHVTLPNAFGEAGSQARAQTGLATIDAAVHALADVRGWSTQDLDQAFSETMAGGIQCVDVSPWKASPSRSHMARVKSRIYDDGFARAHLEVADRDGRPFIVSADQITWATTLRGMRAVCKGLRWISSTVVILNEPLGRDTAIIATIDQAGTVDYVGCEVDLWSAPTVQRDHAFQVIPAQGEG